MRPERFRRLCAIVDRRQPDLTVLMDNVHKPHNVSAVIRTCDAAGVLEAHAVSPHGTFRSEHCSASGSGKWVPIRLYPDHASAFATLKSRGMTVFAAHLTDGAIDFREVDYTRPTAIILGAELDGVGDEAASRADGAITIPMVGAVPSLNVSVAAAIILYEAQRQRAAAGFYDQCRLDPAERHRWLFEYAYPRIAEICRRKGLPYPQLDYNGEIVDKPRPQTAGTGSGRYKNDSPA